jgi:hypothetical protein
MVLTNYANSFTREYMTSREVHFLVVIPSSRFRSFPKVLNTARQFSLSLARVRTAGSSVRDFLECGDVVMEVVGISGHNGDEFPVAMAKVDSEIIVQNSPMEEITVRLSTLPLSLFLPTYLSCHCRTILRSAPLVPVVLAHLSVS